MSEIPSGETEPAPISTTRKSWRERFTGEFRQFAFIFLYLWVLLALFAWHQSIVLAQHGIDYTPFGVAFVKAWVLAKVMLVAEKMNLASTFRHRPLVFPILHKSFAFAVIFVAFAILEDLVVAWFKGKGLAEIVPDTGGGSPGGVITLALIMGVALIPYFAYREVGRVMGREKLHDLLLKARRDYS